MVNMAWQDKLREVIGSYRTQADFARAIDVWPSAITKWLAGKAEPSNASWRKIEQATGRSRSWFYENEQPEEPTLQTARARALELQQIISKLIESGVPPSAIHTAEDCIRAPVYGQLPHDLETAKSSAEGWIPVAVTSLQDIPRGQWGRVFWLDVAGVTGESSNDESGLLLVAPDVETPKDELALLRLEGGQAATVRRVAGLKWPPEGAELVGRVLAKLSPA